MIYYNDLEKKVFDNSKKADELIVLSGYIGIDPIQQTQNLKYDTKVIYGMYEESGISEQLHNSVVNVNNTLAKTDVLYASNAVHSKCYIWRNENEIVDALTGSANFTVPGLSTPGRELLADVSQDSYKLLNDYVNDIIADSINCCDIKRDALKISSFVQPQLVSKDGIILKSDMKCEVSLLGKDNEVPEMSGLNWGLANGHVAEGDAYIPITKKMIEEYPFLFPPKQMRTTKDSDIGKKNRQNDYIELIWDDGTVMKGLLEGNQEINGIQYPNKIASFPKKSIMGFYLRERLGVDSKYRIKRLDLVKYGKTTITISLEGEGVYGMNFAPNNRTVSLTTQKEHLLQAASKSDIYGE